MIGQGQTMALGDVTGDGAVDVVVWETVTNKLQLHVSSGGALPTFQLFDLPQLEAGEGSVLGIHDIDGDGRNDIVVAWWDSRAVTWHRNLGGDTPTFELLTAFSDPAWAFPFQYGAVGDIDADGDLDMIVTSGARTYFARSLQAQGGGESWQTSWFSANVRFPALADIDGDEDLDAAVVRQSDFQVVYMERQPAIGGGSTFVTRVVFTGNSTTWMVAPGDLDGDGDIDLVSTSNSDDAVRIHWNGGGTPPTWSTTLLSSQLDGPRDVALSDIDGDGDLDVVACSETDDELWWFRNDGGAPPQFTPEQVSGGANGVNLVRTADMDGDADPDIVVCAWFDDTIRWHRNDLDRPDRTAFRKRALDTFPGPNGAVAADFNRDGRPDVAELGSSPGPSDVRWRRNLGGDPASFDPITLVSSGSFYSHIEATDLDADGWPDLLVSSLFGTRVRYYHNGADENTTFTPVAVSPSRDSTRCAVGDLDGDGDVDILVPGNQGVFWMENIGGSPPDITTEHTIDATPGRTFQGGAIADFDGDGDNDIIVGREQGALLLLKENVCAGSFPEASWRTIRSGINLWSIRAVDLDQDGDPDILVGGTHGLIVFENDGASPPQFTERWIFRPGMSWRTFSIEAADLDADGDLDLIVSDNLSRGDSLMWLESQGDGSWTYVMHVVFTGLGRSTGFPADVDGDGDLDIVASLASASQVAWFENTRPRSDLTGDNLVNASDIAYLLGSWGACEEDASCRADLNGDRVVNAGDLAHLLGAWSAQQR